MDARQRVDSAVEVDRLVRVFTARRRPPVRALDDVSLTIPRGEVHGLLGPNGAGKSTLVKILATVLLPTSGSVRVCGRDAVTDPRSVRRLIGISLGGDRGVYGRLTARENLHYWGALYRVSRSDLRSRAAALLERVGLAAHVDERVETFSRGMKQRLHLARSLIGGGHLLLLDEPTAGMDPLAARDFRTLIGELRSEGHTVLLATHDMAEAEALCARVTLIDRGRVIATESPQSLRRLVSRLHRIDVEGAESAILDEIRRMPGVAVVGNGSDASCIHVEAVGSVSAVLRVLTERGVTSIRTRPPSLEEVYISLIGDRGLEV